MATLVTSWWRRCGSVWVGVDVCCKSSWICLFKKKLASSFFPFLLSETIQRKNRLTSLKEKKAVRAAIQVYSVCLVVMGSSQYGMSMEEYNKIAITLLRF